MFLSAMRPKFHIDATFGFGKLSLVRDGLNFGKSEVDVAFRVFHHWLTLLACLRYRGEEGEAPPQYAALFGLTVSWIVPLDHLGT